jgi:Holliday junction DNA helicase RuvA
LRGIVVKVEKDYVVIDVHGVGYLTFCPSKTIQELEVHSEAVLFIDTHVREDNISLYGFVSEDEQACFRSLITVKGVGSKLALSILGAFTPYQIAGAILAQDKALLATASGVGPKLAARILMELKNDRLVTRWQTANPEPVVKTENNVLLEDAVSALVGLQYNRAEAYRIVTNIIRSNSGITIESLLKQALREFA